MLLLTVWMILCAVPGILAYTGVWRRWLTSTQGYAATWPFVLLVHAVATGSFILSLWSLTQGWVVTALVLVGVVLNVCAAIGLFWCPQPLLPAWWKERAQEERDEARQRQYRLQSPERHHTRTDWCLVNYPETLYSYVAEGADFALAFPTYETHFQPTLVFASAPYTGPVSDACVDTLASFCAAHPDSRIAGADLWGGEWYPGRRVTLIGPYGDEGDVLTVVWLWVTGTQVLTVTARMLPMQAVWAQPFFEDVVARLLFTREPVAQSFDDYTVHPLDDDLTRRNEHPIELLPVPAPTDDAAGVPLSPEARDAFFRAATPNRGFAKKHGVHDRGAGLADASDWEALAQAGLWDGDEITELGHRVADTLDGGERVLEVWIEFAERAEYFTAIVQDDAAVVSHTAGNGDPYPEWHVALESLHPGELLRRVLAWVELAPGYMRGTTQHYTQEELRYLLATPRDAGGWRNITVAVPEQAEFSLIESNTGTVYSGEVEAEGDEAVVLEPFSPSELAEQVLTGLTNRLGYSE